MLYKTSTVLTPMTFLKEGESWDTLGSNQVVLQRKGLIYTLTVERAIDLPNTPLDTTTTPITNNEDREIIPRRRGPHDILTDMKVLQANLDKLYKELSKNRISLSDSEGELLQELSDQMADTRVKIDSVFIVNVDREIKQLNLTHSLMQETWYRVNKQ